MSNVNKSQILNCGNNTISDKSWNSGAIGYNNKIDSNYSFVDGNENTVNGDCSEVCGHNNIINTQYSHASGESNIIGVKGYKIDTVVKSTSNDDVTLTFQLSSGESLDSQLASMIGGGICTTAWSKSAINFATIKSVDISTNTIVVNNFTWNQFREDLKNGILIFFTFKDVIKNIGNSVSSGSWSDVIGTENIVVSSCSHAEGYLSQAVGTYAHAEGKMTTAAWGSHTEGCATRALANASHAENRCNKINSGASYSHVEGVGTVVDSNLKTCHVAGYMARAKDEGAYVWNGADIKGAKCDPTIIIGREPNGADQWQVPGTTLTNADLKAQEFIDNTFILNQMYPSHGKGTYNINPQGGIDGFYIGNKTIKQVIEDVFAPYIAKIDWMYEQYIKDYNGNIYQLASGELLAIPASELPEGPAFAYRSNTSTDDTNLVKVLRIAPKYTQFADNCFMNCKALESVNIPSTFTTINNCVFKNCLNLTNVNTENIISIGNESFYNCKKLTTINLSTAETLGDRTFWNCENLTSISSGSIYQLGISTFTNCIRLESIILDNVISTSFNCFQGCIKLNTLQLNSLKVAVSDIINGDNSLVTLALPSITKINDKAFRNCKNLQTINFSDIDFTAIPTIGSSMVFDDITNKVKCIVANGTVAYWTSTSNWSSYVDAGKIEFVEKSAV